MIISIGISIYESATSVLVSVPLVEIDGSTSVFYASSEWKSVREEVIARDQGYDMGHRDYPIKGKIYVHHMNPMDVQMLKDGEITILDPEYLISVSMMTHEAIHFGDSGLLPKPHVERMPGDTLLWGKRRNDHIG